MLTQDLITAAQTKAAELQTQIDQLNQQITMFTAQRDLHNAAATSLLSMADEQRAALDILISGKENVNV